jgi:hypothetical protein
VGQQASSSAGVFTSYSVGFAECSQSAKGDVLQVAYRGWDNEERHSGAQDVLAGLWIAGEGGGPNNARFRAEGGGFDLD